MKRIIQLLFLCSIGLYGYSQSMEEIIFPRYISYSSSRAAVGFKIMPYIFKAKLTGLKASSPYYYMTKVGPDNGNNSLGSPIMLRPSGEISSYSNPSIFISVFSKGWGTFTTDAQGSYTGWFAAESYTGDYMANEFKIVIGMNNGAGATNVSTYIKSNLSIKGLFIEDDPVYDEMPVLGKGAGIRSTATAGTPKNVVFLYDNTEGTGRPVSSAFVQDENLLSENSASYRGFYKDEVYSKSRTWGTVIPRDLPTGIRRIEQYSWLADALVGFNTSPDGVWESLDGGVVSTVNPAGNANVVVVDGAVHNLLQDRTAQTITFGPLADKTYGDAPFRLTATSSAGLSDFTFTSSDATVASITGNMVIIHKPGTITITATERGNSTYNRTGATATLKVDPAGHMITFDPLPAKTYGDAAFDVSPTANSGLLVSLRSSDESIASVNGHTITIRKAGTVDIIASQAGNGNYPAAPEETRSLVIAQADLTFTADNKSKAVGEANPVLTFQYSGFQYNDNLDSLDTPVTISTTADPLSGTGDYSITLGGAATGNYKVTFVDAALSVFAQTQEVQFSLPAKTYGDDAFDPAAVSTTGAVPVYSSSNPRVAVIAPDGKVRLTGAGTAYITAAFPASNSLPFTTKDQLLTVTKADLTITPDHATRKYGADDPVFTATYTGLKYEDDAADLLKSPVIQTTATATAGVGDYSITASGAVSEDYEIHYETGVLTVEKALLTATPDNKTRPYGEDNPVFTVTYTGFANGENSSVINTPATASSTATKTAALGDHAITASGASDNNYDFDYGQGTLTITAGTRTIDFEPFTIQTVGNGDLMLTGTISTGEQLAYSSSNTSVAVIIDGKIHIAGPGKAIITATAPANPNYGNNVLSAENILVVDRGVQVISFGGFSGAQVGQPVTIPVTTNAGLPVKLSLSDSSMATLNGLVLTPLRAGTLRITAIQAGNDTWQAASVVQEVKLVGNDNIEAWASGKTTVEARIFVLKAQKVAIQLFSLNGKKVYSTEKQFNAGMNQHQLVLGDVPAGVYILYVQGADMKGDQKVWIR